jgi:ribosomal-protein-alanine N-acetyltransferase
MDVKIDLSNIIIETNRLRLRMFQETDLMDFYVYASVPGVGEMAGWPHHKDLETSQRVLNMFIEDKDVFAIVHKEHNKVIGSIGLHNSWANDDKQLSSLKSKEIGYVLAKEYWGRGLMPEAVEAVIEYCFQILGIGALTCGHFTENRQSRRVIEKSGFVFVKKSRFYSRRLQSSYEEMKYLLIRDKP